MRRASSLAVAHPRRVIGIWLALVVLFAALGAGVDKKLSNKPIFASGSASGREYEISSRQFGSSETVIVMLRGPHLAVLRQGKALAKQLDRIAGALVVTPWMSTELAGGLEPAPSVVGLLVNVAQGQDEKPERIVAHVEHKVEAGIQKPVRASIAGRAPLLDAFVNATDQAARDSIRLAIPILVIVLLLVFRSVLAAAIPIISGGSVVAATRGVVDVSSGAVTIELFALGVIGMMGLALGVDYSLLVVSRFRQELRFGTDVATAVKDTVASSGRAVVPAGGGLISAMVVAMLVSPNPLVFSVGFVVIVVAALSMVAAILVVPAMLALLGTNIDRWSLPRKRRGGGAAWRWSQFASTRPQVVLAVVLALLVCAGLAFTLDSNVGNITLLPAHDPGRRQQEAVERGLGPGWVAPIEIAMDGRGRPVTEPYRLRALTAFQHRFERDPAVDVMAGLAPIESVRQRLREVEVALGRGAGESSRFNKLIGRLKSGSTDAVDGIRRAAGGAGTLAAAIGSASGGGGRLARSLNAVTVGSRRLSAGLGSVDDGGEGFMRGLDRLAVGADRLAAGIALAGKQVDSASTDARVLEEALHAGDKRLAGTHPALRNVADHLAAAQQALEQMTSAHGDPQYGVALRAVEEARENLTGKNVRTGSQLNPSFNGVDPEIKLAENQFGLGIFLLNQRRRSAREARGGADKLARGSARLAGALKRLAAGGRKLFRALPRLTHGDEAIYRGLSRLTSGTQRLVTGWKTLGNGADELSGRLGEGASRLEGLKKALLENGGLSTGQRNLGARLAELRRQSPGLFDSGYFYLAGLDGGHAAQRRRAALVINLDRGGTAARMLVIPRYPSATAETQALVDRLQRSSRTLAGKADAEVVVGGGPVLEEDLNSSYRDEALWIRVSLMFVTALVLMLVLRSLVVPIIAAFLNLIAIAASFGLMSLLFNSSLLGGPGYVDTSVIPATIMVMFGLALDYEIFLFARMREEYLGTGSPEAAVTNGLRHTAQVISGAAMIMVLIFLTSAVSSFATLRNFGVAQATAILLDAFIVRLVVIPALMRALGKWAWWLPNWLERLFPGRIS